MTPGADSDVMCPLDETNQSLRCSSASVQNRHGKNRAVKVKWNTETQSANKINLCSPYLHVYNKSDLNSDVSTVKIPV